jgi:hypothetical protein
MKRCASVAVGTADELESADIRLMRAERDKARNACDEARVELAKKAALESALLAELASAHLELKLARATANVHCPHCQLYADWTVRVRTMSGQVHTILCPNGPKTTIFWLKKELALHNPALHILQQIALVRQREISGGSSSDDIGGDSGFLELGNDSDEKLSGTLGQYGVSQGQILDLLVRNIDWDGDCLELIEGIRRTETHLLVDRLQCDPEHCQSIGQTQPIAVAWALTNGVC